MWESCGIPLTSVHTFTSGWTVGGCDVVNSVSC